MAIVHVYPRRAQRAHEVNGRGCWCEPEIMDMGAAADGKPARVMVHQGTNRPLKNCSVVVQGSKKKHRIK